MMSGRRGGGGSVRMPYARSLAGGAGAGALLAVLGGRGVSSMDYAKQAGAGAVAVAVGDYYTSMYGDGSMVAQVLSTSVAGLTFAGINKMALGAQDSWGVLFLGGAVIDTVGSFLENPLGNALGL